MVGPGVGREVHALPHAGTITLCAFYSIPGTDISYGPTARRALPRAQEEARTRYPVCLSACYAMPGTDAALCCTTRLQSELPHH
eukprot:1378814-Rhodomonas_salina.3